MSRRIAASSGRSSRYFSEKIRSSTVSASAPWRASMRVVGAGNSIRTARPTDPALRSIAGGSIGGVHRGERLATSVLPTPLRFQQADAGRFAQRDRGGQFAIGNIAGGAKRLGDLVTRLHQAARHTASFFAAAQFRREVVRHLDVRRAERANASLTALEKAATPPTFGDFRRRPGADRMMRRGRDGVSRSPNAASRPRSA